MELADTSAWARRRDPRICDWFERGIRTYQIATCDAVALELLVAAPASGYETIARGLESLPWIGMTGEDWRRARWIQRELARRGPQLHKSVKIPDLLIAAAAERAGLTVLHYDQDFDTIATVTRQQMRWLATRGSLG